MSKESNKVKELCEFIWYLEDKYKLFDLKIKDIYIWEYIRMQVYYKLAVTTSVLEPPGKRVSIFDRFKMFFNGFIYTITNNLFTLKKSDLIFFSHPRSVLVDNEYIDIYSEYLIREKQIKQRVVDFEADYQGKHTRKRKHKVHRLDWVKQLVYFRYFLVRKQSVLKQNEIEVIQAVENEIFQQYGIKYDLVNLVGSKLKLFTIYHNIYTKVFKKVKPQSIYIVVAYYYAPIIKAAKDLGIETIELQHGIITKYHLGYSFPNIKKSLHYFPDKVMVWDYSWKKIIDYPIPSENILVDSFRYLEQKKKQYETLPKVKNTYLVLSQTAISENIAKKILDNLDFFKGKKILYKLHPAEFDIWKKNQSLVQLQEVLDIEIVTTQKHLYHLMATSEFQVGVFSTALYEGVVFNCKTILLNIQGIEYMEDFIKVNETIILK